MDSTNGRRADSFRDQLEQDIVTGALRPSERLDEQGVAARFGASRRPIREALLQLASAGLVIAHPRRGAFVAALEVREIVERSEVMATLEGICGRLAARRITEPERVGLLAVHDACSREAAGGDSDAYYYSTVGRAYQHAAGARGAAPSSVGPLARRVLDQGPPPLRPRGPAALPPPHRRGGGRLQCLPLLLDGWRVRRPRPGRPRQRPERLAADRGYSNRHVRDDLRRRRIGAVVPQPAGQRPRFLFDRPPTGSATSASAWSTG